MTTRQAPRSRSRDTIDGRDAVGLYLDSIAKTPLLSAQDEVELAKQIEAGVYAEQLLTGATRTNIPASPEELKWLVQQGEEAFNRFVNANLRLVVSVARKHGHNAMPLLDLIQDGNAGLIRAIKKFDYTKGFKFSTYATWWIRQAITRGIAQSAHIVKLPVHIAEQINQVSSARANLTRRLGREPDLGELSDEMSMPQETVHNLLRLSRNHASLDAPLNDDGDTTLGDLVASQPVTNDDIDSEDRQALHSLLDSLDTRSADIVKRRYGLTDGSMAKLSDIGAVWGITAERVRQIERAALKQLQLRQQDEDENLAM